MAEQYLPDTFGAMTNAFATGRDIRRKRDVNALAAQAYGATGDAQQQALTQLAGVDFPSAIEAGKAIGTREDAMLKKLGGAARYLKQAIDSGNPRQVQGAYQAVLPMLRREMPQGQFADQWDPATMEPVLHQVLAMTSGADDGFRVQSTKVGADGFIYTIGRDGSFQNTGIKADPNVQVFDVPGVGPQIVDKRAGTAAPVRPAGASAPPAYGPAPEITMEQLPGADVPPQDVPAMMAAAENPDAVIPVQPNGGMAVVQPAAAPAWVRPDYAGQAATRADEAAARAARAEQRAGIPPGYEPDGQGGARPIKGGPADPEVIARNKAAGAGATDKTRKEIALKGTQVAAAVRRVARIADAVKALKGNRLMDGGPADAKVLQYLPEGRELMSATAGLMPVLTALTRVPGVGAQSDLETRLGNLQMPSLEMPPEVNERTLTELNLFLRDLGNAYANLNTGKVPIPDAAAQVATPQTEADYNALPSGAMFVDPDDGKTYRKP